MNILIVDDETIIREWIQYTLESFDFDEIYVETASNGIEALERLESSHYDVIFIDIQMPRMNGLELIKEIHTNSSNTLPVILSSYNNFDYAREALRYGAFEYILKSECNKETLQTILLKCKKATSSNTYTSMQYRSDFLKFILENSGNRIPPSLDPKSIFPELLHKSYCCFVSRTVSETESATLHTDLTALTTYDPIYLGKHNSSQFHIILLPSNLSAKELNSYLDPLFEVIQQKYSHTIFSSSRCHTSIDELSFAIISANTALNQVFYRDINYAIYSTHDNEIISEKDMKHFCTKILDCIRHFDNHGLLHTVRDLQHWIEINKPNVSIVETTYYNILYSILLYNSEATSLLPDKLKELKVKLSSFTHFSDLNDFTVTVIRECILSLPHSRLYSSHIETVLTFIAENYADIHSVSYIAESVHLNADYLTRLFKKETGENISSYLMKYKLNIASNMLRTTNFSISDIAVNVGIENISYFSKKFKEQFGLQPINYRNISQTISLEE